jgi:zinc D-Ala-D-Ala dipeptidase
MNRSNVQAWLGIAALPLPSGDLRETPIVACRFAMDTDEYQRVSIDASSAAHAEPLLKLASSGVAWQAFLARQDGMNAPLYRALPEALTQVYVRQGVLDRLLLVNQILEAYGAELLVLNGFRTVSEQMGLWRFFLAEAASALPGQPEQDQISFALRYCSDPSRFKADDSASWPTHATGGSVDVTLREKASGNPLYLGGIYLDASGKSETRCFERNQLDSMSDREARRNRRLLFWAMSACGFVNYLFEWWHYDWLTQAGIMNLGFPPGIKASYGLANLGNKPDTD